MEKINVKLSITGNLDHWTRLVLVLIIPITALSYLPGLLSYFAGDDFYLINESRITTAKSIIGMFRPSTSFREGLYYRPFHRLSLGLDLALYGFSPLGFHLTNFVFHLGCCFLVYQVGLTAGMRPRVSAIGMLLFAVHFERLDAVTWISGRGYPISTFFFLCAYLTYSRSSRHRWILVSLLFYLFALLTLEVSATLPLVLVLVSGNNKTSLSLHSVKSQWKKLSPFFAVFCGYIFFHIVFLSKIHQTSMDRHILVRFVRYIFQIFFPLDSPRFSFYNEYLKTETKLLLSSNLILMAFVFLGLIIAAGFWWVWVWRNSRWPERRMILWFFITMLPTFVQASYSPRLMYLPSVGFCLAFAAILETFFAGRLKVFLNVVGAVALIYSLALADRNYYWFKGGTQGKEILNQLKHQYPDLAYGTTIYFTGIPKDYLKLVPIFNSEGTLGAAVKLVYNRQDISSFVVDEKGFYPDVQNPYLYLEYQDGILRNKPY